MLSSSDVDYGYTSSVPLLICLSISDINFAGRWMSLLIVMIGVGLVGLSGSLIRDTLKESPLGNLMGLVRNAAPEPIDEPKATTVLVG